MAYEFTNMTSEQVDEFLRASRHAIIATNRKDGPPQISTVWYAYEDGKIYISIHANSAKSRNVERDPRVAICIDGGHPDGRAVTLYGAVEIIREHSQWRDDMFFRITRRYTESDEAARELNEEASLDGNEALVVVTPTKILARDYN